MEFLHGFYMFLRTARAWIALPRKKEAMKPTLLVDVLAAVVVSVQDGMQHSDSFAHFLKQLDVV
jgi:hypothetical protein